MKYALVTGGARGIGLATAKLLSEHGYTVTATYCHSEEDAARAKDLLPEVNFLRADCAKEGEVKEVLEEMPALDLLVANAGVDGFAQVQDVSEEEYRRIMDTNFGGVLFCCKHAVKKLIARCGAIVTIASIFGERGGSCESVYSASKGAVIAFTKALAKELAPSCVTVNCVSPGAVDTAMNARLKEREKRELESEIPLGRMGTAEEVAAAILFLAENRYITGQILGINGGWDL